MIEQVKDFRIQIDGLTQLVSELEVKSAETTKCSNHLLLAKAWLGKVLEELGTDSPYKAGYKTTEDIEPTADVANHADKVSNHYEVNYPEMNHIEKVDFIRTKMKELALKIKEFYDLYCKSDDVEASLFYCMRAMLRSYEYLCEGRFWLGFELQRIKESK